jgi:hypothetical protein
MMLHLNAMIVKRINRALYVRNVLKTVIIKHIGMYYNKAVMVAAIVEIQKRGQDKDFVLNIEVRII